MLSLLKHMAPALQRSSGARNITLNPFIPPQIHSTQQVARGVIGLMVLGHYPLNFNPARLAMRDLMATFFDVNIIPPLAMAAFTVLFVGATLATAMVVGDWVSCAFRWRHLEPACCTRTHFSLLPPVNRCSRLLPLVPGHQPGFCPAPHWRNCRHLHDFSAAWPAVLVSNKAHAVCSVFPRAWCILICTPGKHNKHHLRPKTADCTPNATGPTLIPQERCRHQGHRVVPRFGRSGGRGQWRRGGAGSHPQKGGPAHRGAAGPALGKVMVGRHRLDLYQLPRLCHHPLYNRRRRGPLVIVS
jgi:hypothetical protein